MWYIIAFFVASLVNVILSTLKNVITIKGGRLLASIASAISNGFGTIIIKMVSGVDLWVATITSIVCNMLGVYIGLCITDKMRKDQLWKITVSVPTEKLHDFKADLSNANIAFVAYETSWEKYKVVDIFSKAKPESKIVREIVKKFDVKYTISANAGVL